MSRILWAEVYSISAFMALAVSDVEAHPPSQRRCVLSHLKKPFFISCNYSFFFLFLVLIILFVAALYGPVSDVLTKFFSQDLRHLSMLRVLPHTVLVRCILVICVWCVPEIHVYYFLFDSGVWYFVHPWWMSPASLLLPPLNKTSPRLSFKFKLCSLNSLDIFSISWFIQGFLLFTQICY